MNTQRLKRERPTIGVLAGWSSHQGPTSDFYRAPVMRGIQNAARSRGCHLLTTWGIRQITNISRLFPAWPEVNRESDFVPVGPWNTDGLIVFSPLLNESFSRYTRKLMAEGFPLLFIASGEQGPKIAVNNKMGIRQAVEHLVNHGHHRIAFLSGSPTDPGDSLSRLEAFQAAAAEFELDRDPGLIAPAWHDYELGYQAMQDMLKRGLKFTAVLGSNDNSAIGAMRAIREAGLKIPQDLAVVGFDDQPNAIAQMPPLSSVHVPLHVMGEQALLMMAEHLEGNTSLESVQIPTRLVPRHSCGCMPEVVSSAVVDTPHRKSDRPAAKRSRLDAQQLIVNEMLSTLPSELRFPAGAKMAEVCNSIVAAFHASLKDHDPIHFQAVFLDAIQKLEASDANLDYWQEMITSLRREMTRLPARWSSAQTRSVAEDMLHLARIVIGESTRSQGQRHQYALALDAGLLNAVTARLSVAITNEEMVDFLNTQLQQVGIRSARILFFEAEDDDFVAWSVALRPAGDASEGRFRTREFPPPWLYPADAVLSLNLLPLVFQNEAIGYVSLDAEDPGTCEVLTKQLAATIKVSRLHSQVVALSLTDELTGLHNRRYIDLIFRNEIARSQRFSHDLSVIMVDIDHFKNYNDQYGHPAGDLALQAVARCLINGRRATDLVARIGGEEFAVILPETSIESAIKVAEKMRASVERIPTLHRPLTISLGVTGLGENAEDPDTLYRLADEALYEAKRSGRNQVCVHTSRSRDPA